MKLTLLLLLLIGSFFNGYSQNSKLETKASPFDTLNISKRYFDFSKCPKENYKKCFEKVSPEQIFNFIGVSDAKDFKKVSIRQAENFIIANIDEEIFKAAINNNHIKFERPYLNFSFWVNEYGKPDVRFFGTNISKNKSATKKLKFIISQIYFDKHFHAEFEKVRNRQITLFIPVGKKGDSQYIIDPRSPEEKDFYHSKVKNTFPPYFKSCNGLEGSTEFTTTEMKDGIKECMKHQYASFLRNNLNKAIHSQSIQKLKSTQNIKKPKFKAYASFKIDETGKPCEHQVITIFPSMEKEILRLIKKLPTATPATLNSKKMKYKYRIPIGFR